MVNRVLLMLFFLAIFSFNVLPVKDTDFGWHYRCGADLLKGNPCVSNEYSYFLADYQAYYPSFIFDALTAVVYDSTGFTGLSILHALLITATAYIFIRGVPKNPALAAILFPIILYLSSGVLNLGWRPQVLTYFLVTTVFVFLQKITAKNLKLLLCFPVLMILWVNTHIGFFTGLLLLGFATGDRLVQWIRKHDRENLASVMWFSGATLLSTIATFINPFGVRVYEELYRHTQSPLNTMIAEWTSPLPFHLILMTGISLAIVSLMGIQKKWNTYYLLTLLYFLISTWLARRNIPLFYTLSTLQLLSLTPMKKITLSEEIRSMFLPVAAAICIGIMIIQFRNTLSFNNSWETYCSKGQARYPCELLKEYPSLQGNIYATYEIGGFLIWQLPQSKVFVDGRMPAWSDSRGESPYAIYLKILQTQPGWNEFLRQEKTDYILIGQGTFLDLLLDAEAKTYGWKKVYENTHHSLFQNVQN